MYLAEEHYTVLWIYIVINAFSINQEDIFCRVRSISNRDVHKPHNPLSNVNKFTYFAMDYGTIQ